MSIPSIVIGANIISLSLITLSLAVMMSIIWRVKNEIDISYKLFLSAFFCYLCSELFLIAEGFGPYWLFLASVSMKFLFSLFAFSGSVYMLDAIRTADGERKIRSKTKIRKNLPKK